MAIVTSGVFPCFENTFTIGAASTTAHTVADMESFEFTFNDNVEEWTPFTTEGWARRLKTGKSFNIDVKGKRNVSDDGNDFVAGLAFKTGQDAEAYVKVTFPDGGTVEMPNAVINVTAVNSGESTGVGPLEFTIMSNGKPTVTPAV